MTHERELTEPVDLCVPDGSVVNPDALGWSRRPLHRANLADHEGRNKRWDYWAVLAGDVVVSCVYSDIDVIGLTDIWWADLSTGDTGGHATITEAGVMRLPEHPGTEPLRVEQGDYRLELVDDDGGTTLSGRWVEADGRPGSFEVAVALPSGHESLNVVIPWDDTTFNYTSKHWARPAVGHLSVGDRRWEIGGAAGDAWGVLDVGRGRWPHDIRWNWGGGSGRSGDDVIGLQIGGMWTEGSGFTENGLIVNGRLHKLGDELTWDYDWDEPMAPWTVTDPGGRLQATLTPRHDKHTDIGAGDLGSHTHQVFGTWAGELTTDEGRRIAFSGLQGFAEEARQRW